jgi:DNA polymerase I
MSVCAAIKQDGLRCKARTMKGSEWCFNHHPDQSEERRRHASKGGKRGDTETRTLTGRRRMDVQKLTDRLNAPVQGTGADGLKLALALLRERRDECTSAVPVLVCHDEIVVECNAEQAMKAKAWLERAMVEGMDTVVNGTDEGHVPVEVDARIARSWGEES